jgi:hypothetical protein
VKVVCTVLRGGRGLYLKPLPLPDAKTQTIDISEYMREISPVFNIDSEYFKQQVPPKFQL